MDNRDRGRRIPRRARRRGALALGIVLIACVTAGCQSTADGPAAFRSVTGKPTAPAPPTTTSAAPPRSSAATTSVTPTPTRGTDAAWSADFTGPAGTRPDPTLLTARTGGNGWGNGELETYTARPANAALDGAGHLALNAVREQYTGSDAISRQWTSARLDSLGKWSFTSGTLAIRMKVPAGTATWPAFWLEGTDLPTVDWPAAGEIDVIEALGGKNELYQSLHGPNGTKAGYAHSVQIPIPAGASVSAGYHVFAITRSRGRLVFAVDGRDTGTVTRKQLGPGEQWVFDKPMFFIVNLAMGGVWPGPPTESTPSPSTLLVDWIKFAP